MSRIRTLTAVLLTLFLINLLTDRAHARNAESRWTLAEWLEQRDRNRMMDLWLSMNSPSPYEVMAGASYLSSVTARDAGGAGGSANEESFTSYAGELRAYAQFVGLTVEYANLSQENMNDLAGMLNLRLFGDSLQNSSLTLSFGQRSRTMDIDGSPWIQRNLFSQAGLQIYLTKSFGLDAHYRHYSPAVNDVTEESVTGNQTEASLFIDFKKIRVYGAYSQDLHVNTALDGSESSVRRNGIRTGIRLYY